MAFGGSFERIIIFLLWGSQQSLEKREGKTVKGEHTLGIFNSSL